VPTGGVVLGPSRSATYQSFAQGNDKIYLRHRSPAIASQLWRSPRVPISSDNLLIVVTVVATFVAALPSVAFTVRAPTRGKSRRLCRYRCQEQTPRLPACKSADNNKAYQRQSNSDVQVDAF
jgi:hypothetical protein